MPKNFPHFRGEKRSNRDKDTRGEERGATGQGKERGGLQDREKRGGGLQDREERGGGYKTGRRL